jgi:TPR repeat protein
MAYVLGLFGLPKNRVGGLRLLTEAAVHGDHRAEYLLGTLYESGLAVPRNVDAARYWFRRAAPYIPNAAARLEQLRDPTTG